MADHPAWDYFMYETLPDGRKREFYRYHLEYNDIRADNYDLDLEEWCGMKHFYWTAQEAALISFDRDPNKVELSEDDNFVFDEDFRGYWPAPGLNDMWLG
jgi:hypothetical protein